MEIVKVRLRKPTRVFTFTCDGLNLKRDEHCIVRSDRGLEFGVCVVPPEPCAEGVASRYKMNVLRRASSHDESNFSQLQIDEQRAKQTCSQKIRERKLPMKLVDAEYTFDRQKIIFYFTAIDRVDFRDLVKDLAHDLKARIELRHIQVRDEAKIVGGLGVCGLTTCCSTWITEFRPISMRMAKVQNLSLNPTKISGQCGRLLCCLAYENDMYKGSKAELGNQKPPLVTDSSSSKDELLKDPKDLEKTKDATADADSAEQIAALEDDPADVHSVVIAMEDDDAVIADGLEDVSEEGPEASKSQNKGAGPSPQSKHGKRRRRRKHRGHRPGNAPPGGAKQ